MTYNQIIIAVIIGVGLFVLYRLGYETGYKQGIIHSAHIVLKCIDDAKEAILKQEVTYEKDM